MGSFKVKLVGYFLLLSLLPLAAAFWGFSTVAARSETRRVDARLQAGVRASLAAYDEVLDAANGNATRLARDRAFQHALRLRDRRAIERMLRTRPNLSVEAPGGFRVGPHQLLAATRRVGIGLSGTLGSVVAAVPLDRALSRRLEKRSGLEAGDHIVLVQDGRIVAGPPSVQGRLGLRAGKPLTLTIGGTEYRTLVAGMSKTGPATTVGVVTPQASIDAAKRAARNRLLVALVAALVFVGCVAYIEGRTIVRTIRRLVDAARAIARGDLEQRVPVQGRDEFALLGRTFNQMAFQLQTRLVELDAERARLRDVISRFGEALAATHDSDQLLRLIVETAMEATGAAGGVLVGGSGELIRVGYPDKGEDKIEVPLQAGSASFGSVILFGEKFTSDDRMTAVSLASHAVVALENARLHRIVERQALVDGLTGLANRRQCEETLTDELARVQRFGGSLAVVVADLDWFKDVNDRHGHPAGDTVLRAFAELLQEELRDVDLAGRWGGEEFLMVLPGTDLTGGARVAERIRAVFAGRIVLALDGTPIPVTASFGVAASPPARTASELFAAADAAMYQAKRAGKNRVETAPEPVAQT
jgi:diguanylate cyclase (GGDEF)-like protein